MLAMWAAGVAGVSTAVVWWRIVGPGFVRLAGGVTLVLGLSALVAGAGPWALVGSVLTAASAGFAGRPTWAAIGLAGAATGFALSAMIEGGVFGAATGALVLGGVTVGMLLGHWYLIDPTLPRWALRRLDLVAAAGILLDVGLLVARGALDWEPDDAIIGWAFIAIAALTALLLLAVFFALKEPSYSGVMAATGLLYLAVLSAFGSAFLGRTLLDTSSKMA